MSPLPSTQVFHPGWSAHHRPTAESSMTGVGDLTRAGTGPGTPNPDTGQVTPPAPTVIKAGLSCRVQASKAGERVTQVGESSATLRTYLVAVPTDCPPVHVDDTFTLTACNGDTGLVGRPLRVRDVLYGTEVWQRDLFCEDDMEADRA